MSDSIYSRTELNGIYFTFKFQDNAIVTTEGDMFTTLSEMTDADKGMNPLHFGSGHSDSNPDRFWLRLEAVAEVYCI